MNFLKNPNFSDVPEYKPVDDNASVKIVRMPDRRIEQPMSQVIGLQMDEPVMLCEPVENKQHAKKKKPELTVDVGLVEEPARTMPPKYGRRKIGDTKEIYGIDMVLNNDSVDHITKRKLSDTQQQIDLFLESAFTDTKKNRLYKRMIQTTEPIPKNKTSFDNLQGNVAFTMIGNAYDADPVSEFDCVFHSLSIETQNRIKEVARCVLSTYFRQTDEKSIMAFCERSIMHGCLSDFAVMVRLNNKCFHEQQQLTSQEMDQLSRARTRIVQYIL